MNIPQPMKSRAFILGNAIVYPDRNLVVLDGVEKQLPEKCIRLLQALLQGKGNSVRRDDLLDSVWGAHLGSDELLNNGISKLRHAIGYEYNSKKIIETVPKFGYRLRLQPQPFNPKNHRRFIAVPQFKVVLAFSLIVIALVVVASITGNHFFSDHANVERGMDINELTKLRGIEYGPDYRPNGHEVLFAQIKPFTTWSDLYVQNLESGDVRQLTFDKANEHYPSWDRLGDNIAYVSVQEDSCSIMVMQLQTEEKHHVFDCTGKWPRSLDWADDGENLISSWKNSQASGYQIYHLNWRTKNLEAVVKNKSKFGDLFPRYSHSGQYLAWDRITDDGEEIVIYDRKKQSEQRFATHLNVKNIRWSNDDSKIYITSMLNRQKYKLSVLDIHSINKRVKGITSIDGMSAGMSVNPNNGNIAFDQYTARQQLLAVNMQSGAVDYNLESSFRDDSPVYSRSGNLLVFRSNRSGKEGIWLSDVQGGGSSRMLFDSDAFIDGISWLEDEKSIIYASNKGKFYQLYQYNIASKTHKRLFISKKNAILPSYNGEDDTVYYTAFIEGKYDTMRYNLRSNKTETVVPNAYNMRASADGKWLFFCKTDVAGLWRMSTQTKNIELFIEDFPEQNVGNWVLIDQGVIFYEQSEANLSIRSLDWQKKPIWPPVSINTYLMR
ncbi:MAG TPA: hypothetical protein ENJ41_00835, partial [Oceanospirillales bacterium]|nr:hypothetical protein [Oceanospirillales bacterium]